MLGERYVVTKGDNLWRIAARTLGSGKEWPRIWRYNNRREVVHVTGAGVPNPDLIHVGQTLLIPRLPNERPPAVAVDLEPPASMAPAIPSAGSPQPAHPPSVAPSAGTPSLSRHIQNAMKPISFKFRTDYRSPPMDAGAAIVEFRMTGDFILMTKRAYPAAYVTSRGEIELQVTQQANHAYGKLVSDNRFIYDPKEKRVAFRSMLVSQSNTPNAPSSAIGVEVNSQSPLPKLRAEIRLPKLEGSIEVFNYIALDVKLVIEITPKPQSPQAPRPPAVLVATPLPVAVPEEKGIDWAWLIGLGLLGTGVVIVVGTIIEDVFTEGAGVVDDPASFKAAAAAAGQGLAMMGFASAMLPKARLPASVKIQTRVELSPSARP